MPKKESSSPMSQQEDTTSNRSKTLAGTSHTTPQPSPNNNSIHNNNKHERSSKRELELEHLQARNLSLTMLESLQLKEAYRHDIFWMFNKINDPNDEMNIEYLMKLRDFIQDNSIAVITGTKSISNSFTTMNPHGGAAATTAVAATGAVGRGGRLVHPAARVGPTPPPQQPQPQQHPYHSRAYPYLQQPYHHQHHLIQQPQYQQQQQAPQQHPHHHELTECRFSVMGGHHLLMSSILKACEYYEKALVLYEGDPTRIHPGHWQWAPPQTVTMLCQEQCLKCEHMHVEPLEIRKTRYKHLLLFPETLVEQALVRSSTTPTTTTILDATAAAIKGGGGGGMSSFSPYSSSYVPPPHAHKDHHHCYSHDTHHYSQERHYPQEQQDPQPPPQDNDDHATYSKSENNNMESSSS